jgi:transcriptional regulator with XRE-family HTH domain
VLSVDIEEARTIGWALWRVRDARGKSLRVVAGLAGMSKDTLNRIERGLLSPTLTQIHALAEVLQIPVSELTRLPVPAPANGHTDSTTDGVRLVLDAIDVDHPGGLVLPVAVLRHRVTQIQQRSRACRFAEVATELPGLIRDLHTTLATGTDHGELLGLAVYLHVHVTRLWLVHAAAPTDLIRRSVFLARHLAQEHGQVTMLGMAGFAVADVLLNGGAPGLGNIELDSLTLPPTTADTAGLVGLVTTTRALAAILDGRPDDAIAPMDAAAEIAGRFEATGETDILGFPLASTNVEFRRVRLALEAKEPDRAVSIAQNVHPERHPFPVGQAQYWVNYGRALSQLRGRHNDAARALRNAERSHPHRVRRDPFVRDTIAVLLRHSRRGSPADQELRGMARRAGLPV